MTPFQMFALRYPALAWLVDSGVPHVAVGIIIVVAMIVAGVVVTRFVTSLSERVDWLEFGAANAAKRLANHEGHLVAIGKLVGKPAEGSIFLGSRLSVCEMVESQSKVNGDAFRQINALGTRVGNVEASNGGLAALVNDARRKVDTLEVSRAGDYETAAARIDVVEKLVNGEIGDRQMLSINLHRKIDAVEKLASDGNKVALDAFAKVTAKATKVAPPIPDEYLGNIGKVIDVDAERAARIRGRLVISADPRHVIEACTCEKCADFFVKRHAPAESEGKPFIVLD